jgi:hypothetical protein
MDYVTRLPEVLLADMVQPKGLAESIRGLRVVSFIVLRFNLGNEFMEHLTF